MKALLVTALLIAIPVAAMVNPPTDHYNDAAAVSALIATQYNTIEYGVRIQWVDEMGECYIISWANENWNSSDEDWNRIAVSLIAVAEISRSTSWSSAYVSIGFSNKFVVCSTSGARWLYSNYAGMSDDDFGAWMYDNLVFLDY